MSISSHLRHLALALLICFSGVSAPAVACAPFRLWASAPLPIPPPTPETSIPVSPPGSIAASPLPEIFRSKLQKWREENPLLAGKDSHQVWLKCVTPWVLVDSDQDGVPDWSAFVDGQPSSLLIPFDEDIDGDGSPNFFDPQPFQSQIKSRVPPKVPLSIPDHLRLRDSKAAAIQNSLFREFQILAIDHTDEHSSQTLDAILQFLRSTVPKSLVGPHSGLRILYAFRGHDLRHETAAYHRELKAMSLVGKSALPSRLDSKTRLRVLAAFAHELGHVFLFDHLSPNDLLSLAHRFGGWSQPSPASSPDLLAKEFFGPHPLRSQANAIPAQRETALKFVREPRWAHLNLVSEYSMTNRHEWFAEAFAAHLMKQWVRRSTKPRPSLVRLPNFDGDYWTNYENLSMELAQRLHQAIESRYSETHQ